MLSVQKATYISYNVQTPLNFVQTLLNCVCTLIYPFGCSLLMIRQAGWPVGWNWLLPPGVMPIQVQVPIQVQAHEFISLGPWQPFYY